MKTLRVISNEVIDSTNIEVTFTENLTLGLVTSNISIIADTPNVPNSEVLEIKIFKNILSIKCQPLTPLAFYFVTFQSVPSYVFESVNGDARISEDGVSNKIGITAPLGPDNAVQNYLKAFYKNNIYDLDDSNTLVSKYVQSLSVILSRALYDIRQVKNENYLSFTVTDERKVRGGGPFDRLNEEGSYEILRVGRNPTNAIVSTSFVFDDFPFYPVTLQQQSITEKLAPNSVDDVGIFNINSLTFNLNNAPVTRVSSIVFTFNTASPIYTYNISEMGYQIKDSRYDQEFGFAYLQLENNQIRISDKVLEDPNFAIDEIISVEIQYQYKDLGIIIDPTTVDVYAILGATRETLPPIINVFNLPHAPVVDSSGNIPKLGGIVFTDPNSNGGIHPAFISEIPFRLNALPATPGQYSVDYTSGTIYVYGANLSNDGTGPFPPLATYRYKFTYKNEQDYVYDDDLRDLVALPFGNLLESNATIAFNYEQVYIPNIDYKASLHTEELSERVDNRLLALNVIKAKNSPITNVFRIYNETSGEIYTLNRWNDDKIYFRYNNPPQVNSLLRERTTFSPVTNELLFVNTTITNSSSLRVFKILLNNNNLISLTEDSLGSSFNSSLLFTDSHIFTEEKWFNTEFTDTVNINNLNAVGQYIADYANGIIYVAVSNTQDFNIGTVTYKNNSISPKFPHIISVDDIYYQISPFVPKNKKFSFTSFSDGSIIPQTLDVSDEAFLNNNTTAPYQIYNKNIGAFVNSSFVAGVTNQVNYARSLFEYTDLLNSTNPINFASDTTVSGFNISVSPIVKQLFTDVQYDGVNYYVLLNENIPYLSSNITYTFTVTRLSDSAPLWDSSGIVVSGDPLKLILSGINSPSNGDLIKVDYTFTINDLSRVVVDYNKGDLFIDYTYLADELIISYEYGDNIIDFRQSKTIPENTQYFVTYKAGALRDALLKNFGTLVNIPELSNFDIDFNRERYRDALMAALSSFIQGPTVTAIKNIGQTISHIEPEIIESIFQNWSLGNSLLNPEPISTTGAFQLLPAKFSSGALVNDSSQTISFPVSSNIRLEEGTFETWILPQWNGLDNDAILSFNITIDGYNIPANKIFIGASEYHPTLSGNRFNLSKNDNVIGVPNTNKDGVYIYYDKDSAGSFDRWYIKVIDGYISSTDSVYKLKISTTGTFYDTKSLLLPKPSNVSITSGSKNITFNVTLDGYGEQGLTFLSDLNHYILDFGEKVNKNRLSIFKDTSGYINFKVFDRNERSYIVSYDASGWRAGDPHHVAASWKLNTRNNRDEIHLFIDGFEVPNIIKYGQKLRPYLHEKFRTVDPEEIIGLSDRDIISATDLKIIAGTSTVTSTINFSAYNIFVGDSIFIDEIGFSSTGYTITNISGQILTLNTTMPLTLNNGKFSINKTNFEVTSEIDIFPNIEVTTIHALIRGNDVSGTINTDQITSVSTNFGVSNVKPGFLIRVENSNLSKTYNILQVIGNTLIIDDDLPITFSGESYIIYSNVENEIPGVRAVAPSYSISKDANFQNILTIFNNVFAGDLILIRTLGVNFRDVKREYYVWSDGYENILKTTLPPPIALDEVDINKVILSNTLIGPNNSTLTLGQFVSNNLVTDQPTNDIVGRTLSVNISGNNVDFTSPVQVTINGYSGITLINEVLNFTDYGTLDGYYLYTSINYIQVNAKPKNSARNALVLKVKEKYTITHKESDGYAPIIRYSYQIGAGYNLYADGPNSVRDENNSFSQYDVNNYLYIQSPAPVAGYYLITGVSSDLKSLTVQPTAASATLPLPFFSGGYYQILNVTAFRSGLQNGYFTLEMNLLVGQPYLLSKGFYELSYSTYADIKIDLKNNYAYLGSDFNKSNQLNGILDQVKIYSIMLTDTRIGESIPSNQRSITKDFNSLKPLRSDKNTLMLINMDQFPFTNEASYYINVPTDKHHFQSSVVVNENFNQSTVITNEPIVISNEGILDARKEGTIEFWVNHLFDTGNDPNNRFYFDAYGAVIEEAVSVNNTAVKLSSPASRILKVTLQAGDPSIDYFAGGKLEIDTQRAVQEESVSLNSSSVMVAHPILQVISVTIVGDLTEKDYFVGGSIGSDKKTIYLGNSLPDNYLPLIITYQTTLNKNDKLNTQVIRLNKKLPNQNSKVLVTYLPKGLQGDRISLWKDEFGYVNFGIVASGIDYVVRAPTRWARNTWHRIKASYKINSGNNTDQMKLFLDGYEWSNFLFGTDLVFGEFPAIMGGSMPGDGYNLMNNIKFKDPINELFIGSQYSHESPLFGLIDNFRISNIFRPIFAPYGEPLDVNYNSNLDAVFPVTSDLYTTYLLDFDSLVTLNDDFAVLQNRNTGLFDFSVNIFDSLGIINNNSKVKQVLEKLIKVLKPANSRVFIKYIT